MIKRSPTGMEGGHLSSNYRSTIQFVVKVNNSRVRDQILEYFSRSIIGLYLGSDEIDFIHDPITMKDPIIKEIPKEIVKRSDVTEIGEWLGTQDSPCLDRLGCLAYGGEDIVAFSVNHSVGDGGFVHYIFEHILDDPTKMARRPPKLTQSSVNLFKPILANFPKVSDMHTHKMLTTMKNNPPKIPLSQKWQNYLRGGIDFKELVCFNKETGKLTNLTEHLLTSLILATSVLNGEGYQKSGVLVVQDLRNFLPNLKIGIDTCNFYTALNIADENIKGTTTVKEAQERLRRDLSSQIEKKYCLETIRGFDWAGKDMTRSAPVLSSYGGFDIKEPIVDFYASPQIIQRKFSNIFPFSCSSNRYMNESGKRSLNWYSEFSTVLMETKEAERYNKLFVRSMTNLDQNMTMNEAYKFLEKIK